MTTIERQIRADQSLLLLVDHQEGLLHLPHLTGEKKDLKKNVAGLIQVATAYRIPIVISHIPDAGDEYSEIGKYAPDAPRFVRSQSNPLEDAPTRAAIDATGRTTLLVAGVVTEIAASMPAVTGKAAGYTTALVYDASAGWSPRSEHAALERLAQAGVLTFSLPQLIGELLTDFSSEAGKTSLGILMG